MALSFSDYIQHDATGLAGLIRGGAVSAAEVLEAAIDRACEINPRINAIVDTLFDEARRNALGSLTGPFAGVPWAVKDLGTPVRGARATRGSRAFAAERSMEDSVLVRRFRAAGLNIFCTSTTPEFGSAGTTESLLHGATRNPWNLSKTAGGSSGGAAALVSAGVIPAAHGSDSGGSIRLPASCCGLLGLKPSRGRLPVAHRATEVKLGTSVSGALTRSVRDMAALLDALHGPELGSRYVAPPPRTTFLEAAMRPPERLRIALQVRPFSDGPVDQSCIDAAMRAADLCRDLGHEVEEARPSLNGGALNEAFMVIGISDVYAGLRLAERDLGREIALDELEPVTATVMAMAGEIRAYQLLDAELALQRAAIEMAAFQENYDIILTPGVAQPPVDVGILALDRSMPEWAEAMGRFSPFTSVYNQTGQPAVTVPLHWTSDNLPVGVQFAGRLGSEEILLSLAHELELISPWFDKMPKLS
ncbi:MAG: amidase [Lysobacteraceae bacterium]|nr:MAG: amidase [Xanthomonadaceae bacterium]